MSYTLAGNAPESGSDADATYWTWLGDGLDDMDEPAVSMQYLDCVGSCTCPERTTWSEETSKPGRRYMAALSPSGCRFASPRRPAMWRTCRSSRMQVGPRKARTPRDSAPGWMVARSVGKKPATRDRGKWHSTELAAGVRRTVSACCPVEPITEYWEATSEPRDAAAGQGKRNDLPVPAGACQSWVITWWAAEPSSFARLDRNFATP